MTKKQETKVSRDDIYGRVIIHKSISPVRILQTAPVVLVPESRTQALVMPGR